MCIRDSINSFYAENVLYDQEFIKTEVFEGTVSELVKQLAAKMGENIGITKMSRLAVGEDG